METQVKERPILFSGPMVRALLAGNKSQTRRAVKPGRGLQSEWLNQELINSSPSAYMVVNAVHEYGAQFTHPKGGPLCFVNCPHGQPGDRLWVRETYQHGFSTHVSHCGYLYRATDVAHGSHHGAWCYEKGGKYFDHYGRPFNWKPSIFMRRQASRLLLEITAVRCERLQDISEADAVAEGVNVVNIGKTKGVEYENYLDEDCFEYFAKDSYATLWEKINGLGSFATDPWVWVVEFKIIPNE